MAEENGLLMKDARSSYQTSDTDASKLFHDSRSTTQSAEEGHMQQGDYLKACIFGGLDGILTSFGECQNSVSKSEN